MKSKGIHILLTFYLIFVTGCSVSNTQVKRVKQVKQVKEAKNIKEVKDVKEINEMKKALKNIVPEKYKKESGYDVWEVKRTEPLPATGPYYGIGVKQGGRELADKSWLIELYFPELEPSASLSQGILFLVKENGTWTAWYRYR